MIKPPNSWITKRVGWFDSYEFQRPRKLGLAKKIPNLGWWGGECEYDVWLGLSPSPGIVAHGGFINRDPGSKCENPGGEWWVGSILAKGLEPYVWLWKQLVWRSWSVRTKSFFGRDAVNLPLFSSWLWEGIGHVSTEHLLDYRDSVMM